RGFGEIRSTGMARSSASRASPSASGAEDARIADRPRPMPRVGSATGGHLLCQLEVGLRAGAMRVVMDDRTAEARCLAEPHVARNHRLEDERREMLAHLALDVLRELRARVVH